MSQPEDVKEFRVSDSLWVVINLKNFSVISLSSADVFISRVLIVSVCIAGDDQFNSLDVVVH